MLFHGVLTTSEARPFHIDPVEAVMFSMPDRLLLWTPRILGILVSAFIGLFALDAFSPARPILDALPDFLVHLVPAATILGLVLVSWRWEWIGAFGFLVLAVTYSTTVGRGHADWVLAISGPLLIVGALYFWSWQRRRIVANSL